MKLSIEHIFTKALIILMTFFLCLPCFGKREIKQKFNIPIANFENNVKANESIVCQAFTKKGTQKFSLSYLKKEPQHHYNWISFFQQKFDTSLSKNEALTSVPIYILHEQYLI